MQGRFCGDVRAETVGLSQDGIIKLTPYMFQPNSICNYEKTIALRTLTYLAPEELEIVKLRMLRP